MNKAQSISRPLNRMLRSPVVAAIAAYQRYVSPYKGFSCAHRRLYGGESCSQFAKRIVLEQGTGVFLQAMSERFRECREANQILQVRRQARRSLLLAATPPDAADDAPRSDPRRGHNRPPDQREAWCSNFIDGCCTGCTDGLPCNALRWGGQHGGGLDCNPFDGDGCSFDCGGLDCFGLDCSGPDCSGLDCSGSDCCSPDCGSCGG